MTDEQNPCHVCHGKGSVQIETAPGEWRWTGCGTCAGKGTAWAAQLQAEYRRGYDAAMERARKALSELGR